MPKGETKPELYTLIYLGFSVEKLMELGYAKPCIYQYRSKYKNRVKPKIEKALGVKNEIQDTKT